MDKNKALLLMAIVIVFFAGLFASNIFKNTDTARLAEDYYKTEVLFKVSPSELKERMLNNEDNFIVIDVRDENSYNAGHIKGAISMPYSQIEFGYGDLPADKELIVYCWSHSCMLSREAGLKFAEMGIVVKELNVGWDEWKDFGYATENSTNAEGSICTGTTESC